MKNFRKDGMMVTLTVAAAAGVKSGKGILIGNVFGIAATDAVQNAKVEARVTGTFDLDKVTTEVWAVGDPIYWVVASGLVTNVAGSNMMIGTAMDVTANPSTTGHVRLNGPPGVIPSLVAAAAVADVGGALTGTTDGSMQDIAAIDIGSAGGNTYADATVEAAVNTAITAINVDLKELQTAVNLILARLRTAGVIGT